MRYLLSVLVTAGVLLASIAALNWVVDPAGLFQRTTFGHDYAKALATTRYGLLVPDSVDERLIKVSMIESFSDYDCVVIGSSHVMQIGSDRKHRSFHGCQRILNLGVSGAGLEDHIVLSWLAVTEGDTKKLILGIDPWTLAFGKDERWKVRYAERYKIAREEIDQTSSSVNLVSGRWWSLINFQYTERSLKSFHSGKVKPRIEEAQAVDEDVGGEAPITLPDGSHIYSSDYISKQKRAQIPAGGGSYKTEGKINESSAVELYQRMILWAKERGVESVLLMTPYHPNVWMLEASSDVKAMVSTEAIVRKMGDKLNVPVVGSFRPDVVGCLPDEFYDFMHPMASCVARFTAQAKM